MSSVPRNGAPEMELQKWGQERLMPVLLLWMDCDVQPTWAPFPGAGLLTLLALGPSAEPAQQ